jgi:hypothetical protein
VKHGDNLRLYVDGAIESENVTTRGMSSGLSSRIGACADDSVPSLNGFMDEIKLYNRALSRSEIRTEFNSVILPDTGDDAGI